MVGQHYLTNVVALLELHHLRTGEYPLKLADIKYADEWNQLAVNGVRYCPAADRKTYFVELTHGWLPKRGKPTLTLPADYWVGTGYRASVVKDCP
jgi:hypothetical protein